MSENIIINHENQKSYYLKNKIKIVITIFNLSQLSIYRSSYILRLLLRSLNRNIQTNNYNNLNFINLFISYGTRKHFNY